MSKAFTSEDHPAHDVLPRPRPRLAPGEKRYVTPEGHRALQQALDRLLDERSRAAQERLAELEEHAAALAATLAELTVVAPDPAQAGRAFFGAWVTLEDEDGGRARYRIVGPDEADAKAGLISVDAPLARALLGKSAGDEAVVERPRGATGYTVISVEYPGP